MSVIRLIDIELPSFGIPDTQPQLPTSLYSERLRRLSEKASMAGIDVVLIYADREHFANMAYLTGFEPRFEEALADPGSGKRTGGRYRPGEPRLCGDFTARSQ